VFSDGNKLRKLVRLLLLVVVEKDDILASCAFKAEVATACIAQISAPVKNLNHRIMSFGKVEALVGGAVVNNRDKEIRVSRLVSVERQPSKMSVPLK